MSKNNTITDGYVNSLLEMKVPPVKIPTLLDRINNKMLVLQYGDQSVLIITNDRGYVEHQYYVSTKQAEKYWGKIDDNEEISLERLGILIKGKMKSVARVYLGDL